MSGGAHLRISALKQRSSEETSQRVNFTPQLPLIFTTITKNRMCALLWTRKYPKIYSEGDQI